MDGIKIVIGSWGSYNECNERALGSKWLDLSEYTTWDEIANELKNEGFVLDGIDEEETKRYMHHYNFPSYSVGETRPSRGPGRREIGHGALAERALIPVLPSEEEFPYTCLLYTSPSPRD